MTLIKDVRVPTLIVTGEADPLMPAQYIREEVMPYFPQSRVISLPCGHEIPYEMPAETGWIIEAFLAATAGGTAGANSA